jgi:signal transduction histidine kinase
LATVWKNLNEFKKARIKLTGQYIFILFLILNIFTLSIWGILLHQEQKYQEKVKIHWQKKEVLFPNNMTVVQIQQVAKPMVTKQELIDWQHLFLQDLKYQILWLEFLLIFFAGICSYWLAGRNLQPIKKKMEYERQFLSDVSHELKNPLAALQTTLEVSLNQVKWKKAELQEVFLDLLQEIKRLINLTNDLLFLEKMPTKSRKILNSSDILLNVQKTLENFAKEKGISFDLLIENQQKIYGNQDDLTKMFFNLLHNAVKFSNPHEKVKIFIKNNEISIQNKGKTIPKKFQERIWQRFSKGEISRNFQVGGSGLGLSIAKKIADEHQAKISFTSEKEKTVFKVLL